MNHVHFAIYGEICDITSPTDGGVATKGGGTVHA
jgi:hypothetical protein